MAAAAAAAARAAPLQTANREGGAGRIGFAACAARAVAFGAEYK